MPCQSVPHMHKALSCVLLKRFISVTKEIKQRRELIPAAQMKFCVSRRRDAQKKKYTVVFAVSVFLLFKYEMLPGSIFVLPIDSPLFSLAFVHLKRGSISLHRRC